MTPEAYVSRALSLDGIPAGASSLVGNYSASPTTFFYQVPQHSTFRMARMLITIRDQGAMNWDNYGAHSAAVLNGVVLRIINQKGTPIITTNPFKSNAAWAAVSFDARFVSDSGNDKILVMPWSFIDAGEPMELLGGSRIEAIMNDDFSFLVDHRIAVNGELR